MVVEYKSEFFIVIEEEKIMFIMKHSSINKLEA